MSRPWYEDKKWTDQFAQEIKQILGMHLIGEAPEQEDVFHNTDLMVIHDGSGARCMSSPQARFSI